MICCYCHREIEGEDPMMVYHDGHYRPAHRDCGRHGGTQGRAPRPSIRKRCRKNKALRQYEKDHGGEEIEK